MSEKEKEMTSKEMKDTKGGAAAAIRETSVAGRLNTGSTTVSGSTTTIPTAPKPVIPTK